MLVPRVQRLKPAMKRWASAPYMRKLLLQPRRVAPVVGQFLTPLYLISYVLAIWRLSADLGWTSQFFVSDGLFSRWQVWLLAGVLTQMLSKELDRFSASDDTYLG